MVEDIHTIDGPAFIFDPVTYFILDANKIFIELYGYSLDELKGMRVIQLRAEQERPDVIKLMETTKGNVLYSAESRHQNKEGRQFTVLVYGRRYHKGNQELYMVKIKVKQ